MLSLGQTWILQELYRRRKMAEKSVLELFTSSTCPHCPRARRMVKELLGERDDFVAYENDTTSPEGKIKAQQFRVRFVPSLFIQGPGSKEILAFTGTPSKEKLLEMLDVSQGKPSTKKKGLFGEWFKKR